MNKSIATAGVILGILIACRPVGATPISLRFDGSWGFVDPQQQVPTFWAAMATYGVTEGTGLSFLVTIDDGVPGTTTGGGFAGYVGAVQGIDFTVGSLSLGCSGSTCAPTTNGSYTTNVGPNYFATGPSMTGLPPIGYGFLPSSFDFRASPLIASSSLVDALADPAAWQSLSLWIIFTEGPNGPGGGGIFRAQSRGGLTFVSKTSPVAEPTTLPLVATGVVLYLSIQWRGRRARLAAFAAGRASATTSVDSGRSSHGIRESVIAHSP